MMGVGWRRASPVAPLLFFSQMYFPFVLFWITLAKEGKAEKSPESVFNTVVYTWEVCGEEELTVKVLDIMRDTIEVEGDIITFNIVLKRLAKAGNT